MGTCVVVVAIIMLQNHFILGAALAFLFASVAWMAGRDVVIDDTERMNSFYRSLARVDAGHSHQRFTAGPVGRWAATLAEGDYAIVAGRIADATKQGDDSADQLLREIYQGGLASDQRRTNAPQEALRS